MRVLLAWLGWVVSPVGAASMAWETLPPLPDREGLAGTFAGVSGGALVVAGGAHFPGKKPWEGGKKVWRDTVFVLEEPKGPAGGVEDNGSWKVVGRLPGPRGYGVSATWADGVICAGGSDSDRHYRETIHLTYRDGRFRHRRLPDLPVALADAAGVLVNKTLFVCGGTERPGAGTALNRLFALDLSGSDRGWVEREPCPGRPRILAVAAAVEGSFLLFGGAALRSEGGAVKREYLRDAWSYREGAGWRRLAELPAPSAAAASPAPVLGGVAFLLGGDDGERAGMGAVEGHPGFPGVVRAYDLGGNRWTEWGSDPAPRVTLPSVAWRGRWVLPSGEVRPGVRSPEVRAVMFKP